MFLICLLKVKFFITVFKIEIILCLCYNLDHDRALFGIHFYILCYYPSKMLFNFKH